MFRVEEEVKKIAEEILCMLVVDGYNIDIMTKEEVGQLVDRYLQEIYDDYLNDDNYNEACVEEEAYDGFESFYKNFTTKVKEKNIHMEEYLN
ncbi:hypothetical protein [Clostridium sp. HMP27]|uniref:hypothetical protein n=1 Tax=Clostridium sp. HMP27 TaxID=1487921 RepID=UPI00052CD84F|nr:hypothetical protein [Clostridium sp. HMP27]KGK87915.1 hypothetical protein DP68_08195 [Clostridium sp. HMP27]